jgi:cytochrome c peroxidase
MSSQRWCLTLLAAVACGQPPLFTDEEWEAALKLAAPKENAVDRSNRWVGVAAAEQLGHRFYFDPAFSGTVGGKDMLGRPVDATHQRSPTGTAAGVSCNTCHDVTGTHAGVDYTSKTGVSIGAGAYDVSSQPTFNAAWFPLLYWNGRSDSLWSQIVAVTESPVSMGSNRLAVMWRIASAYRADYEAVFNDHPLPVTGTAADAQAALEADGQCRLVGGSCPASCSPEGSACWPRFPLKGRPGSKAGCQRGDSAEPFADAFDCMTADDRDAVTRVYVNFSKAIAAYEHLLVSRDSPLDHFLAEGATSTALTSSEQRGLKLFIGKAGCVECHGGPMLSDFEFHNIGVAPSGPYVPTVSDCSAGSRCDCTAGVNCLPFGAEDGLAKLSKNGFRRTSKWSDDPTDDSRAKWYSGATEPALRGAWRTPGLRDIARTAPYMHTGAFATLRDVLEHYNSGAAEHGDMPGALDEKIVRLNLTERELDDLEAFLRALDGAPLDAAIISEPTLPQ